MPVCKVLAHTFMKICLDQIAMQIDAEHIEMYEMCMLCFMSLTFCCCRCAFFLLCFIS